MLRAQRWAQIALAAMVLLMACVGVACAEVASCPGVVVTGVNGEALCEDGSGVVVDWEGVDALSGVPELSVEQAMQLSGAVLLLWAVAYAGVQLRRLMEKR